MKKQKRFAKNLMELNKYPPKPEDTAVYHTAEEWIENHPEADAEMCQLIREYYASITELEQQ